MFPGVLSRVLCSPPGCCCWALGSSALLLKLGTSSPVHTASLVPRNTKLTHLAHHALPWASSGTLTLCNSCRVSVLSLVNLSQSWAAWKPSCFTWASSAYIFSCETHWCKTSCWCWLKYPPTIYPQPGIKLKMYLWWSRKRSLHYLMFQIFQPEVYTFTHCISCNNLIADLPLGHSAVELRLLLEEPWALSLLLLLHSALLFQLTELQLLKPLGSAF